MSKNHLIKEIPMHGKVVVVKVSYSLGGMNYFSYQNEPRGYYLHVTPEIHERRENGMVIKSFAAFSGVRKFLLEVTRKSDKKLKEAVDMVTDDLIEQMIAQCNFE